MNKNEIVIEIDRLCDSLLCTPLDRNIIAVMMLINVLNDVMQLEHWPVRIAWAIRNRDSALVRDCFLYGIKPCLEKGEINITT